MATKRDLVEAHAFSRRRLVTAFVSGAPSGREVEPARPGRTIIGGLALSVLLVAGAAIAGVFTDRPDSTWKQEGLIVSKETAALYVILEESDQPELRPVVNNTSARLVLGPDVEPKTVSQADIDAQNIGPDIGILNSPATPPDRARLIETGWTACTGRDLGIKVDLSTTPSVAPDAGYGFTVVSDGRYFVIARGRDEGDVAPRAHRYELAKGGQRDAMLSALGLPNLGEAVPVSPDWLALFPTGGDLGVSTLGLPAGTKQFVNLGERGFAIAPDGRPTELDPFAFAVFRYGALPGGGRATEIGTQVPTGTQLVPAYGDAHWPDRLLDQVPGQLCAQLVAAPGELPGVQLAVDPAEIASATEVPAQEREVSVERGHGALVMAGDWDRSESQSLFLIDSRARANALVGPSTPGLLGYQPDDAALVPDSWVNLFVAGVPLSQEAALCPPERGDDPACG